jgi:hypothetical protein
MDPKTDIEDFDSNKSFYDEDALNSNPAMSSMLIILDHMQVISRDILEYIAFFFMSSFLNLLYYQYCSLYPGEI